METTQPTTPEQNAPTEEKAFVEAGVLELRKQQKNLYETHVKTSDSIDANRLENEMQQAIDDYLSQHGIASDNPKYNDYKTALRSVSYDKIRDEDGSWKYGQWRGTDRKTLGPTGNDKLVKLQEKLFGHQIDTNERREKLGVDYEAKLKEVQDEYAAKLVKRTQKIFEGKKSDEAIDEARQSFDRFINAAATEMMLDLEEKGLDSKAIAREIDAFINHQTDIFISTFEEMRMAVLKKRSPIIQRVLKKWASWGAQDENLTFKQRILSKENLKGNFKKGSVFAVAGIASGIAVGTLAAPALAAIGGGAFVAAGIGALIAKGGARSFINTRINNVADADRIAQRQGADLRARSEELQNTYDSVYGNVDLENLTDDQKQAIEQSEFANRSAHEAINHLIDARTEFYRRQNTKRFVAGAAISGTFGLAGGWIGHTFIAPHVTPLLEHAYDAVSDKVKELRGSGSTMPSVSPTSKPGDGGALDTNPLDGPHPPVTGNKPEAGGNNLASPEVKDKTVEWKYGKDEVQISSGEGFYRMFGEMGVKSSDQAELLKAVGPKLQDKGLAYWDNDAREWRMNMTENGKIPHSAIKMIAEAAHKHDIETDYDKYFEKVSIPPVASGHETIATAHTASAEHIERGEGFRQTLTEAKVPAANQTAVLNNTQAALINQGIGYKMNNGDVGISMPANHTMPSQTLDLFHDTSAKIDHNIGIKGMDVTTHDGIDFHESIEASTTTTGNNSSFLIEDIGKAYDSDAKAYYSVLRGVDRNDWQDLLTKAAPQLHDIRVGGEPLTYKVGNVWHFREVKNGLPFEAQRLLTKIAEQNKWTLAS